MAAHNVCNINLPSPAGLFSVFPPKSPDVPRRPTIFFAGVCHHRSPCKCCVCDLCPVPTSTFRASHNACNLMCHDVPQFSLPGLSIPCHHQSHLSDFGSRCLQATEIGVTGERRVRNRETPSATVCDPVLPTLIGSVTRQFSAAENFQGSPWNFVSSTRAVVSPGVAGCPRGSAGPMLGTRS